MPGCNTGRNIQKYKGSGGSVSTLQDVTDNGNTTTGDIITTSGFFIGDGSKLTGISGASSAFSFQETSDTGNTTSNTIQFTNTITSLTASGNVIVTGNVTASNFYGDGSQLTSVALKSDLTSNTGRISALETKTTDISYTNGTTRINGNLTVLGNTTTLDTVNLIVQDPILQLSNASASVDSGILIARPSSTDNVFVGFDQSLSEFAIGFTDSHAGLSEIAIKDGEDFTVNVHGNVEASYYFGNGSQLTGVALKSDFTSNVGRIGVLESEVQPVNRGGTNITSYGTGDMLFAGTPSALSKLTPGTSGYFLQTNGTGNAPTWENVADIGSATPANLYTDDFITGGPWSGITDANLRVLGNVSNLSNQLVARDDKGDIFVSNVNAIKIYGDGTSLTGVALSTDLTDNSTRINTVSTDLADNSTRIGTVSTDLSSNTGRISALETKTTDISYTNSGTSKTTIASDLKVTGKLGIGESSPTTPLHIECADTVTHYQNGLLVKQSSSSYPAVIGIRTSSSSQDPFISFMVNSDSTGWSYGVDASDSNKMKWGYDTTTWNSTRMTLTDDGKLGIGTSSPTTPLHIECADNSIQYQNGLLVKQDSSSHPAIIGIRTSSTSQDPFISFMVSNDSTGWSYGVDASESNKLKWAYNTSVLTTNTRMTLTDDGKLGIGTSSPTTPLHIECADNSIQYQNGLLVKQDSSSHPAIIGIRTSSTSQDPFISFMVSNDSTGWSYGVDASESNKLKWAYNTSVLTTNTRMTLTDDGKLGIGTTSPNYKLDVFGAVNFTGVLTVGTTASSGTSGQVLTSGGSSAPPSWTTVSSGGSSPWTTSGSVIHYNTGNVGINTSTPQYKLDVAGDIRTTSEGGFRGNGRNITGINVTSERNQTIVNFGQQSSLKQSANGDPL